MVDSGTHRTNYWTGIDVEPGAGVDVVLDCRKPPPEEHLGVYHLVLCTEVFEHVQDWSSIVITIHEMLRPGGVALMTCASTGRRPHGARGAVDPEPEEWYRNVPQSELNRALLMAGFPRAEIETRYNPTPGDVYAWARKAS